MLTALAVAYGVLAALSATSQPERSRVADLESLSARDAAILHEPNAERLVSAFERVEQARHTRLGL